MSKFRVQTHKNLKMWSESIIGYGVRMPIIVRIRPFEHYVGKLALAFKRPYKRSNAKKKFGPEI